MKLFKALFYIVYIPSIVIVLLISINLYDALDLFKDWGWFKYFSDLPVLGRKLLYTLCALMTLELIVENIYTNRIARQLKDTKAEVKKLEGQLYDKAQEEVTKGGFEELQLDEISK